MDELRLIDHLEVIQENIIEWELDPPLDLSLPIEKKMAYVHENLRLKRIIKTVSGFFAGVDPAQVEGKPITAFFDFNDEHLKRAAIDFLQGQLQLRNRIIPIRSSQSDRTIFFNFNWKGYTENG
ncbi:hypothetical protein RZS08_54115, partial [Arthrospira platensis SPKY1]|nr:hypothetical protein [Arthrospira platensis SPKY1]